MGNSSGNNEAAILQRLMDVGIIDSSDVEYAMNISKLEEEVSKLHKYAIYQGDRGRWMTYVHHPGAKNHRKLIARYHKEDLLQELYKLYTQEDYQLVDGPTVGQFYPKWLEFKRKHTNAPTTIRRIETDWKKYYKDTPMEKKRIMMLKKIELDEWAHDMIKKYNMTQKMYINMSLIIRQMLDYAVDLELISKNAMKDVHINGRIMFRPERKKHDESQVYSYEEQDRIIELAWNDFGGKRFVQPIAPLAIPFQFYTGLRLGELVAIRYEDISADGLSLTVQRMARRDENEIVEHTKGSYGDREVLLTSEARHIIETAKAYQEEHGYPSDGYIFSVTEDYLTCRTIADLYRKYCKDMGIPVKSSHKARKTFASTLLDADINLNTVREMMGHTDEKTTLNYYCYDRKSKVEKLKKMEQVFAETSAPTTA